VDLLAAVLLDLRGACSDWEDALLAKAGIQTSLRIRSAQVVLQTGLDLRSVVTAAAAGQQQCGERQRSGQEDQADTERTFVHGLDSPAIQKGSQAGERSLARRQLWQVVAKLTSPAAELSVDGSGAPAARADPFRHGLPA
jgi:hypothetical protein